MPEIHRVARLYPSIPHLPGSRAARDKVLSEAQARRLLDPAARKEGDEVIVQEKLDGSCVAIRLGKDSDGKEERLLAFGREGRLAAMSPNTGRRLFAEWLSRYEPRLRDVVGPAEVLAGEFLALVHGTRYALAHEPFVPFDVLRDHARLGLDALEQRLRGTGLVTPRVIHRGPPMPIAEAVAVLGERGFHGAGDPPEGLVYRLERRGAVVLVAKWVRPDKEDGALLPEKTGKEALYNWRPPWTSATTATTATTAALASPPADIS